MKTTSANETLTSLLAGAKGILFDMDGVLVDSEPVHDLAVRELVRSLGQTPIEESILNSFKGIPERDVANHILALYPELSHTAAELIARKNEIYTSLFHHVVEIQGARDFARRCRERGYGVALVTSSSRIYQARVWSEFKLAPFFHGVITAEDVTHGKPDPEPYRKGAAAISLRPEDCLVLEDSLNGVRAGKAAGCAVVGITTTFSPEALLEAGADYVIESFEELEACLE